MRSRGSAGGDLRLALHRAPSRDAADDPSRSRRTQPRSLRMPRGDRAGSSNRRSRCGRRSTGPCGRRRRDASRADHNAVRGARERGRGATSLVQLPREIARRTNRRVACDEPRPCLVSSSCSARSRWSAGSAANRRLVARTSSWSSPAVTHGTTSATTWSFATASEPVDAGLWLRGRRCDPGASCSPIAWRREIRDRLCSAAARTLYDARARAGCSASPHRGSIRRTSRTAKPCAGLRRLVLRILGRAPLRAARRAAGVELGEPRWRASRRSTRARRAGHRRVHGRLRATTSSPIPRHGRRGLRIPASFSCGGGGRPRRSMPVERAARRALRRRPVRPRPRVQVVVGLCEPPTPNGASCDDDSICASRFDACLDGVCASHVADGAPQCGPYSECGIARRCSFGGRCTPVPSDDLLARRRLRPRTPLRGRIPADVRASHDARPRVHRSERLRAAHVHRRNLRRARGAARERHDPHEGDPCPGSSTSTVSRCSRAGTSWTSASRV